MFLLKILICLFLISFDEIESENFNQIESKRSSSRIDVESGQWHDAPEDGITGITQGPLLTSLEEVREGGDTRDLPREPRRGYSRRRRPSTTTTWIPLDDEGGRDGHMGRLPRRRRLVRTNSLGAPTTCKKSNSVYLALIPFWICVLLLDNA